MYGLQFCHFNDHVGLNNNFKPQKQKMKAKFLAAFVLLLFSL